MKLTKFSVFFMLITVCAVFLRYLSDILGYGNTFIKSLLIAVAIIFFVLQLLCVVKYRFSFKKIGFFVTHIGVLLLIVGALLSAFLCKSVNFNIPVNPYATYGEIQMEDGTVTEFGFDISVTNFNLSLYENSNSPKEYEATLLVSGDATNEYSLKINQPVKVDGWKFYLMGYDEAYHSYVSLYAKNDPGNLFLLFGFISVAVGTAIMCFSAIAAKVEVRKS